MKFILKSLLFAVWLVGLMGTAHADFDQARTAYEKGNYTEALAQFMPLAEHHDVKAQFIVGALYEQGQGVVRDIPKAALWYGRAAEQGHSVAQERLGLLYLLGRGVNQNNVLALKWLTLSARQGDAVAMYQLGTMYDYGRGVDINPMAAYELYTLAEGKTSPDMAATMREVLAKKLSPKEIAEATALAKGWKKGDPLPISNAIKK